uniref:Uncharacterized protein n=1 Tax=Glossina austeni TaxID=7395 RepID=A0A1A9V4G2_GLOAU
MEIGIEKAVNSTYRIRAKATCGLSVCVGVDLTFIPEVTRQSRFKYLLSLRNSIKRSKDSSTLRKISYQLKVSILLALYTRPFVCSVFYSVFYTILGGKFFFL